MEKIKITPPQETCQKEIRSPIVCAIHTYEESLCADVLTLRKQIKVKLSEGLVMTSQVYQKQLDTAEKYLFLFREIFASFLPQSPTEAKDQKPMEEDYERKEEEKEFILFSSQ